MVSNCTLLRSQRHRVFQMLREAGLEPADFSWSKQEIAGGIVVSKLSYREGTYYFQFSWYELSSWCVLSPGRSRLLDYEHPMNWREQEASFLAWAQCLKREIETPDPWAEMAKYRIAIEAGPLETMANESISAFEAEQIAQRLPVLAETIGREFRLSDTQAAMLRGRLQYVSEAARRQKSRDWAYTTLGVCVTTAMAMSIPPRKANALWGLMKAEIGRFVPLTTHAPFDAASASA